MNKKIIFFDVDGTLVDVRPAREYVPESTIKAVRETRKKGNLCFLCTGRSLAEIYPHILDVGFDGIIGAGGGFVTIGDEMLYHKKVSDKDVHRVVDFFEGGAAAEAVREQEQWLNAIINDTDPLVKPEQAFVVTQILEGIYKSAETGKEVFFD